jgi:hypothetical protein
LRSTPKTGSLLGFFLGELADSDLAGKKRLGAHRHRLATGKNGIILLIATTSPHRIDLLLFLLIKQKGLAIGAIDGIIDWRRRGGGCSNREVESRALESGHEC